MSVPAACQGDKVVAIDVHVVLVPSVPPTPTQLPHPFSGILDGGLVGKVLIGGKPAAVVGSTATNTPQHVPTPPGNAFQKPPSNKGEIVKGSTKVLIAGKAAARTGDPAKTCNDPVDAPVGTVVAAGAKVMIG